MSRSHARRTAISGWSDRTAGALAFLDRFSICFHSLSDSRSVASACVEAPSAAIYHDQAVFARLVSVSDFARAGANSCPRLSVRSRSFSASVASEQESSLLTDRRRDRRERAPRDHRHLRRQQTPSTTRRSTKPIRLRGVTQSEPVRARERRLVRAFSKWRPHVGGPGRRLWSAESHRGVHRHHRGSVNELDRGNHSAAWQEPDLFTTEIRAAFRSLR